VADSSAPLQGLLPVSQRANQVDRLPHPWSPGCPDPSKGRLRRAAQKWFVARAEVFVRRGQLTLRPATPLPALARGRPLHPDDSGDPYVFRITLSSLGIGPSRVVFSRSPHAIVNAFHLDISFARCRSIRAPPICCCRLC
jgi:hypothetical protein